MIGVLQPVSIFDEADCKPGDGHRRMYATVSFKHSIVIPSQPDTSFAYCAAQFLGGLFYVLAAIKPHVVLDSASGVGPDPTREVAGAALYG
jgi:hypothetical protein